MSHGICMVCDGRLAPEPRLCGLLKCLECGFVTTDISLKPEELEQLYNENYFHGDEYGDYIAERPTIEKNFERRLGVLLRHVSAPRTRHVFEIGCAYGFFLSAAKRDFGSVEGIDISARAIEYAIESGLSAQHGDFLNASLQSPIDVACMWDTIEHLARPDLYLDKLARHMPKGGILAITTGDIASNIARLRGRKWRQIHPPTHLHYFSRNTLSRLLARHGFVVRHCRYDGNYRSLDMIAYIIFVIRRRTPGVYKTMKRLGLLRWDIYVNLYDIMYMIAEKQA